MIRDDVKKRITDELVTEWAVKSCTATCVETLVVYPDGQLLSFEAASETDYYPGTHTLCRANPLCNCDLCAEWEDNIDNVQSDFESKSDYIRYYTEQSDVDNLESHIMRSIDQIEVGFFDDE